MPGSVVFNVVGLPDKAVSEARERVRAALAASGLALPARRITVNLAPADLPKEGSHFDLAIALGIMAATGAIPADALDGYVVLGELSLDGTITAVAGVLPAAVAANGMGPRADLPRRLRGRRRPGRPPTWTSSRRARSSSSPTISRAAGPVAPAAPHRERRARPCPNLRDIKGQETAKRAIEVAAAGGHNLLMIGPAGSGKTMLARRLPSILPPLGPRELLEVSMVHSVAGELVGRSAHGPATLPRAASFGLHGRPGRRRHSGPGPARSRSPIAACCSSTSCPNSSPRCSMLLRQPLESGEAVIARANNRVTYPAAVQLVGAMNPCRCGKSQRAGLCLPARPGRALRRRLPGAHLGPASRPHRHPHRGPRRLGGGSHPAGPQRRLGGDRPARRRGPRARHVALRRSGACPTPRPMRASPPTTIEAVARPAGNALALLRRRPRR